MSDAIVDAVCADLQRRSAVGVAKYGTTLAAAVKGASLLYWLQHAYEETLDRANYLKCAIEAIKQGRPEAAPECYYPNCTCMGVPPIFAQGPLPATICPRAKPEKSEV